MAMAGLGMAPASPTSAAMSAASGRTSVDISVPPPSTLLRPSFSGGKEGLTYGYCEFVVMEWSKVIRCVCIDSVFGFLNDLCIKVFGFLSDLCVKSVKKALDLKAAKKKKTLAASSVYTLSSL